VTQVEVDGFRVVIRIEERGSFMSGSSNVTGSFATLLTDMANIFAGLPGTVAIEGHTDNVPIRTARFESNWDLSAMRAASVANVLLTNDDLSPERILVQGFADTEPRASNDTPEGRAQNRRVEINIDLSEAIEERGQRELDALRQAEEPQTGVNNNQEETSEMLDDAAIQDGEEVIEPLNPLLPNR